jgi:hypothetical protein
MKRLLFQSALVFLLLVAQDGAVWHQISHFSIDGRGESQQQNGGKKAPQSALCVFHITFGTILAAAGFAAHALRIVSSRAECDYSVQSGGILADSVVPAARDPPVLLRHSAG